MIFIEMDWLIIWGTVLDMCSISIVICYKCLRTFTLMRGMKQKADISALLSRGIWSTLAVHIPGCWPEVREYVNE